MFMHTTFSETKYTTAGGLFVKFMKEKRSVKFSLSVEKYNDSFLTRKTSVENV